MYFDDHKKAVTTIMSKRHPATGDRTMEPTPMKPELEMNEGGEMDGKHAAAQEMLGAHHAMSASQLKEALENFIDIHLAHKAKE